MIAAPITGDDGPLGVIEVYAVPATRSTPPMPTSSAPSPARPPSPSPTPDSSATSSSRARRTPAAPTPNAPCARSPRGSPRSSTRPTSWSGSSTEAARLLESDGARIDLWDDEIGALRWAYSAGDAMREVPEWGRSGGLRPRQAVAGLAFAERASVMTADYLDRRPVRHDAGDRGLRPGRRHPGRHLDAAHRGAGPGRGAVGRLPRARARTPRPTSRC